MNQLRAHFSDGPFFSFPFISNATTQAPLNWTPCYGAKKLTLYCYYSSSYYYH